MCVIMAKINACGEKNDVRRFVEIGKTIIYDYIYVYLGLIEITLFAILNKNKKVFRLDDLF